MKDLNLNFRALTSACRRISKSLRGLSTADAGRYGEEIILEKVQ